MTGVLCALVLLTEAPPSLSGGGLISFGVTFTKRGLIRVHSRLVKISKRSIKAQILYTTAEGALYLLCEISTSVLPK
jgi:hypothetical protein